MGIIVPGVEAKGMELNFNRRRRYGSEMAPTLTPTDETQSTDDADLVMPRQVNPGIVGGSYGSYRPSFSLIAWSVYGRPCKVLPSSEETP